MSHLGLSQYYQVLVQNGYENIDFVSDISLEDLQEIGIAKLGKPVNNISISIPLTFSHFAKSQPSMHCTEYFCVMIIGQKILFGSHVTRTYSTILLRPANRPDVIAFNASLSLRPGF